ncbi:MAG: hypothetical protein H7Z38_02910 [Rubrivivax sp.]|nr:hypothetical protein [Pyrinomonadaceae bacterium]
MGDEHTGSAIIKLAKSEVLKTVAYALLRQAYGLAAQQTPDVRQGINFYDEVRRFEINLIRQALLYTSGKQTAAARLLNLNATTLHSKMNLYGIESPFAGGIGEPLRDISAHPERARAGQHASERRRER